MPIQTLFPSSIYIANLKVKKQSAKSLNADLIDEIEKIRKVDDAGRAWSEKNYLGGYTSYASYCRLYQFSSTFDDIRKAIDAHVKKFTQHLEMNLSGRKLQMTTFWVNVMPPGTVHSMHIHPLSTISGTYYVQTPKNCSTIKFEDPRMNFMMAAPPAKLNARPENQRFISVAPKAGQVILFESWMRHEVPANPSASERISISFNYDWI